MFLNFHQAEEMQDIRNSEKDYLASEEEKELSILVSATTRCLPVALSKYLGEYSITQKLYRDSPVYIQKSSFVYSKMFFGTRVYLYRTLGISGMNWARRLAYPLYSGILQPQTMYQLIGGSTITVTRTSS